MNFVSILSIPSAPLLYLLLKIRHTQCDPFSSHRVVPKHTKQMRTTCFLVKHSFSNAWDTMARHKAGIRSIPRAPMKKQQRFSFLSLYSYRNLRNRKCYRVKNVAPAIPVCGTFPSKNRFCKYIVTSMHYDSTYLRVAWRQRLANQRTTVYVPIWAF